MFESETIGSMVYNPFWSTNQETFSETMPKFEAVTAKGL